MSFLPLASRSLTSPAILFAMRLGSLPPMHLWTAQSGIGAEVGKKFFPPKVMGFFDLRI